MLKKLCKTLSISLKQMKFFKNKFFAILLCIAIVITIFTVVLSVMGLQNQLSNAVNTIFYPFKYATVQIVNAFRGFGEYFSDIGTLIDENKNLREEIESLENKLRDAELAEEENKRLREYIEVKKTYNDYKFSDAFVIGSESGNYMTVIMLNKGSGDGIDIGMPVITASGVVGSVCEVGYSWCKVKTLLEDGASVGAYITRTGQTGVISGDINYKDSGECVLNYLPENADIEVGDLVYTSGKGSVYPRGLPVGRVVSIGTDEYTRTKKAMVKCFSELDDLKYVMIVTEFSIKNEEDSTESNE